MTDAEFFSWLVGKELNKEEVDKILEKIEELKRLIEPH